MGQFSFRFLCASAAGVTLLCACAPSPYYMRPYTPKVASVVSATASEGREKEYLTQRNVQKTPQRYEDALLEVQMEDALTTAAKEEERSARTEQSYAQYAKDLEKNQDSWFEGMLPADVISEDSSLQSAGYAMAYEGAKLTSGASLYRGTESRADSSSSQGLLLWGKPAGSVGQGVTLLDEKLRSRLNDALSTTPLEGEARWAVGAQQFLFMPNGAIYNPFRSGGSCRDGIFISYNGKMEDEVRGLFCRQGIGSDWYLMR